MRGANGVSSRAVPVRLGWGFEPGVAYGVGERQPEVQLARLVSVLGVIVRTHGEGARPRLQSQRRRPLHVEGEWLVGRRRAWLGIGSRSGSGSGSEAGVGLRLALAAPARARPRLSHGSTVAETKRSKACSSASSAATCSGLGFG